MRLIKLALRNLLIVTAVLVLFVNYSSAEQDYSSENANALDLCKKTVDTIVSEAKVIRLRNDEATLLSGEAIAKAAGGSEIVNSANRGKAVSKTLQKASISSFSSIQGAKDGCLAAQKNVCSASKVMAPAKNEAQVLEELQNNVKYCLAGTEKEALAVASTEFGAREVSKGMSTMAKAAIGVGAVGGGLLLVDHIGDKKEKKKEKKAEEEKKRAENGIIKDADGNDLQCFSEQNFMRTECFETMLGLCQAGKSTTAGCKAFNSNYCASTGSGTNYCLYADSKNYCSQAGSAIASSPACAWSTSRSDECKKNPEQVSCLYSGSADSLTLACASYPNDPLCISHAAGRIVVQGGAAPTATELAATDGDGASITMSSVIDSGSPDTVSTDANSSTLASTENLFSNSSSVAQKACADGLLQNCGN